jgi:hypothetical protein
MDRDVLRRGLVTRGDEVGRYSVWVDIEDWLDTMYRLPTHFTSRIDADTSNRHKSRKQSMEGIQFA